MNTALLERLPIPPRARAAIRIGQILLQDMKRCDLFKHASAMAYVTLFSLIPSLAATFGLVSLFTPLLGKENTIVHKAKLFILNNLAPSSGEQILIYIDKFLANLDMTKIGLTGVAGLLVSLILLLRQIEIALNRIWLVNKPRNIFTRFIHFWTFLTLGTVLLGLAIGILSGFDLAQLNPFGKEPIEHGRSLLEVITPILLPLFFFTLLYKVVPNTFVGIKDALCGAVPATLMFYFASSFYGTFTSKVINYQAIYGALAAVPVFLMWLYILWIIILFGSLLSWRVQQSFELDDKMDIKNLSLTPEEKLRNHQLQATVPFICTIAICGRFLEGNGKGVSGNEISLRLNIAAPWIVDALKALEEMGIIVRRQFRSEDDYLASEYFPALPPDQLSLTALKERFTQATFTWLDEWQHTWDFDLKASLSNLLRLEIQATQKESVGQIITILTKGS